MSTLRYRPFWLLCAAALLNLNCTDPEEPMEAADAAVPGDTAGTTDGPAMTDTLADLDVQPEDDVDVDVDVDEGEGEGEGEDGLVDAELRDLEIEADTEADTDVDVQTDAEDDADIDTSGGEIDHSWLPTPASSPLLAPDTVFNEFFGLHPEAEFPDMLVDSIRAFIQAEDLVGSGEPAAALELLEEFWDRYPVGSEQWWSIFRGVEPVNTGTPPGYYGLRMLTEIATYQVDAAPVTAIPIHLTVVMVGCSQGILPSTQAELDAGTGEFVVHALDERIAANDFRILGQSLRLFSLYVEAITLGQATLEVEVFPLPDFCATVSASVMSDGVPFAYDFDGLNEVWSQIPDEVMARTDWWWKIYPSHVPEDSEEIGDLPFVTGGMGYGPDGCSPAFIIDDKWLTRRPPHLGEGTYTDLERRVYLPQWLQHEFYHHNYRTWPEFGLEATGHQWFYPELWPDDFEGLFEPDYFAESLARRLYTASPSLNLALRCAPPDASAWAVVELDDVLGAYERLPVENDYHTGTIAMDGESVRWTNTAGVSWELIPDIENGKLLAGEGNPYADVPGGDAFRMQLARDASGAYTDDIIGFRFGGELYVLVRP
jgi:hypothetical protein